QMTCNDRMTYLSHRASWFSYDFTPLQRVPDKVHLSVIMKIIVFDRTFFRSIYIFTLFKRREFVTTLTELKAIAAPQSKELIVQVLQSGLRHYYKQMPRINFAVYS